MDSSYPSSWPRGRDGARGRRIAVFGSTFACVVLRPFVPAPVVSNPLVADVTTSGVGLTSGAAHTKEMLTPVSIRRCLATLRNAAGVGGGVPARRRSARSSAAWRWHGLRRELFSQPVSPKGTQLSGVGDCRSWHWDRDTSIRARHMMSSRAGWVQRRSCRM